MLHVPLHTSTSHTDFTIKMIDSSSSLIAWLTPRWMPLLSRVLEFNSRFLKLTLTVTALTITFSLFSSHCVTCYVLAKQSHIGIIAAVWAAVTSGPSEVLICETVWQERAGVHNCTRLWGLVCDCVCESCLACICMYYPLFYSYIPFRMAQVLKA